MRSGVAEALADIARRPIAEWQALLRARFGDDRELVAQALLWQQANGREQLAGDRYELGAMLDGGATATVWRAYDKKLHREVAIKLFEREHADALDAILAEARVASEVISEHVVRVLDVLDACIVMELVGEYDPRHERIDPAASAATLRPRDLGEAVRWVRDVARGVHASHLRNVFHRDLKPHNVLVTPSSRRAKVTDFGLAARAAPRLAGTPAYIAPEQARGKAADDRAALVAIDVWGLGAIAYDLLAGEPPWTGDAIAAWEQAVRAEGIRPLPRVPRRLAQIVNKALAIDPAERYGGAGELARELDAFLERRPTSFDRTIPTRIALWARRNPQLTITAAVAVMLGTMSLAAYATIGHLREQRDDLVAETARATADRERAARELAETEASLHTQGAALSKLRGELAEAHADYDAVVAAKQRAIATADAATKHLAVQLGAARDERDVAEKERDLYEGFWVRARQSAETAAREREDAIRERDAVRVASDRANAALAAAQVAAQQATVERDAARAERDRAIAARKRADADAAKLLEDLASPIDAGIADAPHD